MKTVFLRTACKNSTENYIPFAITLRNDCKTLENKKIFLLFNFIFEGKDSTLFR